jgi:hypothetical protein
MTINYQVSSCDAISLCLGGIKTSRSSPFFP